MKIIDLINKNLKIETSYQRNKAWTKKISNLLIDSIMNGYFVPSILIANEEVIDGKQRITAVKEFYNNMYPWINVIDNVKKFYRDFTWDEQKKFNDFEIGVEDLGKISSEKILETFIRINNGSIKLNKAEMRLAKALPENREMIKEIAKDKNILLLSNNKKNDSRFKIEELIIRCLTILNMPNGNNDVRRSMDKTLQEKYDVQDTIKKFSKTIDCMYQILGIDTIPTRSFNTIFESIFCAICINNESINSFIANKDIIKKQIINKIDELQKDQMGGGTKFDSNKFVRARISKIEEILNQYSVDKKRLFPYDEKLKLWQNSQHHFCHICGKNIETINDFEADHKEPWSKGGKTTFENLQILCKKCNQKKSNRY